ncbi:hypothetical protein MLD52_16790 [Puniceicoccaceae bacterium K14]|nr:hypothetical protein [Puniceicoccaceae bacterium K14]
MKIVFACIYLLLLAEPLCASSPFMRPKAEAPPPPVEEEKVSQRLARLEFAGYMSIRGKRSVNVYDPTNKRSYWIEIDGNEDGIDIGDFEESSGSIMIRVGGESRRVALNNISIVEIKDYNPKPKKIVIPKSDEVKRQEEEARQMVSNILVEGMERRKQRKAEREARLKERQKNSR